MGSISSPKLIKCVLFVKFYWCRTIKNRIGKSQQQVCDGFDCPAKARWNFRKSAKPDNRGQRNRKHRRTCFSSIFSRTVESLSEDVCQKRPSPPQIGRFLTYPRCSFVPSVRFSVCLSVRSPVLRTFRHNVGITANAECCEPLAPHKVTPLAGNRLSDRIHAALWQPNDYDLQRSLRLRLPRN